MYTKDILNKKKESYSTLTSIVHICASEINSKTILVLLFTPRRETLPHCFGQTHDMTPSLHHMGPPQQSKSCVCVQYITVDRTLYQYYNLLVYIYLFI